MISKKTGISDLAIPPGEYLEEVLAEIGMSKDELAKRMDRPAPKLSAIFKGEKAITPETALQLEKVVGVPAHVWTGLETEYRLSLARLREEEEHAKLKEQVPLLKKYCYSKLVKFKYCQARSSAVDKVIELQRFLGVTSLNNVPNIAGYQPVFRAGKSGTTQSPEATISWLRMAELTCRNAGCAEFSALELRKSLEVLRQLTFGDARSMPEKVREELAKAGVCFALIPHLPGTYAHGATFWQTRRRAVVAVTIRYAWADIFWFSLFHEIGHALLHSNEEIILEYGDNEHRNPDWEREADNFAADNLIPPKLYQSFLSGGAFSESRIREFASRVGIHPGIVVGRLMHDKKIPITWHNDLRIKYNDDLFHSF